MRLEYRRQEAELLFRRIGITFAVYAIAGRRRISFDVIPRYVRQGVDPSREGTEAALKR